jgi:lipopolysaccharide export system permease protein
MRILRPVLDPLARWSGVAWNWLRGSAYAGPISVLVALGVVLMCMVQGYHVQFTPQPPSLVEALPKAWEPLPNGVYLTLYAMAYMRLFVLVGGVVYHIYIIRAYPDVRKMIAPTWIMCGLLAVWALTSQIYARWEAQHLNDIGEVFSTTAFIVQLLLVLGLLLTPPLVLGYYSRCLIMERYLMRTFLQPLLFCFVAFFTLWIVMDLLDNMADFQENKVGIGQIALFYMKMMPFIYVTVAPISLLLATVYVLGRMSRSNELISMLGAGRSMGQVLRPIYIAGCYAAFLGMAANYHWAPVSAGSKEKLIKGMTSRLSALMGNEAEAEADAMSAGVKARLAKDIMVTGLMYRNAEERRTWFVGTVPNDFRTNKMRRIEVRQEDEKGRLMKAWFAKSASYWPGPNKLGGIGQWRLFHGAEVTYENGRVSALEKFPEEMGFRLDFMEWNETPWILMSGALSPDFLGVPDLISYIRANASYGDKKLAPYWTHLFYRFALPWQCIIVVMFAAPLAVVFSRRGLVGGIANAVIIFFALMFLDNLFLNLGRSYRVPSFIAVWLPHLILGMLGVYLFKLRSRNRELPSLSVAKVREWGAEAWGSLRGRRRLKHA